MKNDIKKILKQSKSDLEKAKDLASLLVNDYWKYSKEEIKDLAKEFAYLLIDSLEGNYTSATTLIDNIKEYILND